jgi:hypothetical protein
MKTITFFLLNFDTWKLCVGKKNKVCLIPKQIIQTKKNQKWGSFLYDETREREIESEKEKTLKSVTFRLYKKNK